MISNGLYFRKLCHPRTERLFAIVGVVSIFLALLHLLTYPNWNYFVNLSQNTNVRLVSLDNGDINALSNHSKFNITRDHYDEEESQFVLDDSEETDTKPMAPDDKTDIENRTKSTTTVSFQYEIGKVDTKLMDDKIDIDNRTKLESNDLQRNGSVIFSNNSQLSIIPTLSSKRGKVLSVMGMNSILLNFSAEVKSEKTRWSSRRDKELLDVKIEIENAPIERNVPEVHASLFRNYSMFKRSYELMESMLKVYVYREGEKPIFHWPYMRGIYASEGWFMKLMEKNKHFLVKDPKKAHLLYLPFSSLRLRNASVLLSPKDRQNHLKNYIGLIESKHHSWDKRRPDHFLVACHDWAPRMTREVFGNCIRVLCNTNLASGFKIGKDVSLPVTYIRSAGNPSKDIGGNSPSNRSILAFFAGGMHGNVRPILLKHWHNKEPDMEILGPMPRDLESKEKYRNFMKNSKYCISAKGYEVHTPRVVESIYYGCVPVIISDNYVPPFFEVLNWESFAVFILEDDIPNLRDVLLSIPEDRYIMMQLRVKEVQRYFVWNKVAPKYDLFHMILHSVWFNRVFRAQD